MAGTSADRDIGYWFVGDQGTSLIVREGDPVPTWTGLTFSNLSLSAPSFGEHEWFLFLAEISGTGVTASNNQGMFGWSPQTGIVPIFREGELVALSDGTQKTISSMSFSTVNSNLDFATVLYFTDRSRGTFAVSGALPEPSFGLLALASYGMILRRRRSGAAMR